MYKLQDNGVLRLEDAAWIPDNEDNRDWRQYQKWLSEGNTPLPMDQPEQPTINELTQTKTKQLNAATDGAVSGILYEYPRVEQDTFLRQEHQASMYLEWYNGDQTTAAPSVSTVERIAKERNITEVVLCQRIIANAQYFELASSTVIAQRQRLYDGLMTVVEDDTLTEEQKREAIAAIDETQIVCPPVPTV